MANKNVPMSPSASISLVQLVKKYESDIKNNMYGDDGITAKETAWNVVKDELSSSYGITWSTSQLQKRFANIKSSVSQKLAKEKQYVYFFSG